MTTPRIPALDPATVTGSNQKNFALLQASLGVIPNMTRSMAQSPAVLEGYISLNGALSKGSLSRPLREELALTLAAANHCNYCASAHSLLGKLAGLTELQIAAALKGTAENNKTAAALQFAQTVVEKHGQISDTDFQSVRAAGFSEGEIAEIVAQVALNIFTNYFNNVAKTEIDFPLVEVSVNA